MEAYQFIYIILGRNASSEALLNLKPASCTTKQFRLVTFILTAIKQTLAKEWESSIPTVYQVKAKMIWYMVNEKISAILNDKVTTAFCPILPGPSSTFFTLFVLLLTFSFSSWLPFFGPR